MKAFKYAMPEIIFGRGTLEYAGGFAQSLGALKVFVVSDPGVAEVGHVDKLLRILRNEKLDFVYYDNVQANPRDWQVAEGVKLYREFNADVVVALGGGSPMDAAKAIALLISNGGEIRDYEGANLAKRPLPPMVFIPTTLGSESNISQFTVITDVERRVKMTLISRALVPDVSITDTLLLRTLSSEQMLGPIFDALAHAVESYVSPIASAFTEAQSLKGLDMLLQHLRPALAGQYDDLEQLSIAGAFSGMAFSNAGVGLGHVLAHALGGMYDVVHGIAHALLLPHVMRYNLPACHEKMARLGKILVGDRKQKDGDVALNGIESLERLRGEMGLPSRLRDILPDKSMLSQMSLNAVNDVCLLTNPMPATSKDILNIFHEAW